MEYIENVIIYWRSFVQRFQHSSNDLEVRSADRILIPAILDAFRDKRWNIGECRELWSERRTGIFNRGWGDRWSLERFNQQKVWWVSISCMNQGEFNECKPPDPSHPQYDQFPSHFCSQTSFCTPYQNPGSAPGSLSWNDTNWETCNWHRYINDIQVVFTNVNVNITDTILRQSHQMESCNWNDFISVAYAIWCYWRCRRTQLLWYPLYYPRGMKARVSRVQWSKPYGILAPTQRIRTRTAGFKFISGDHYTTTAHKVFIEPIHEISHDWGPQKIYMSFSSSHGASHEKLMRSSCDPHDVWMMFSWFFMSLSRVIYRVSFFSCPWFQPNGLQENFYMRILSVTQTIIVNRKCVVLSWTHRECPLCLSRKVNLKLYSINGIGWIMNLCMLDDCCLK